MYYVLYALFMFHPENTNDWRITDKLQFQNQYECQKYYNTYTNELIGGLRDYMTANHGPPSNGEYTLLEVGCMVHDGKKPALEKRTPLQTNPHLEYFLNLPEKVDV